MTASDSSKTVPVFGENGSVVGHTAVVSPKGTSPQLVRKPVSRLRVGLVWLAGGPLNPWMLLCYGMTAVASPGALALMLFVGGLTSTFAATVAVVRGLDTKDWTEARLIWRPIEAALATNGLLILLLLMLAPWVAGIAIVMSIGALPLIALPAALAAYLIARALLFEPRSDSLQ